jgi:enoyl-CoA hydratase
MVQRALGPQGAAAMSLFCEVLDAAEAERVGLVWRSYPDDEALLAAAQELAGRAASADRQLLATTKSTMRVTATTSHEQAVEIEVRAQAVSIRSSDFRDRLAALRQKISSR